MDGRGLELKTDRLLITTLNRPNGSRGGFQAMVVMSASLRYHRTTECLEIRRWRWFRQSLPQGSRKPLQLWPKPASDKRLRLDCGLCSACKAPSHLSWCSSPIQDFAWLTVRGVQRFRVQVEPNLHSKPLSVCVSSAKTGFPALETIATLMRRSNCVCTQSIGRGANPVHSV